VASFLTVTRTFYMRRKLTTITQWSVRDGALLIDMGKFKCIELDEAGSLVKVSPSTTGRMLNEYLSSKDKMFAGQETL
jgi:FAD/FMN-containing dehydrogenase